MIKLQYDENAAFEKLFIFYEKGWRHLNVLHNWRKRPKVMKYWLDKNKTAKYWLRLHAKCLLICRRVGVLSCSLSPHFSEQLDCFLTNWVQFSLPVFPSVNRLVASEKPHPTDRRRSCDTGRRPIFTLCLVSFLTPENLLHLVCPTGTCSQKCTDRCTKPYIRKADEIQAFTDSKCKFHGCFIYRLCHRKHMEQHRILLE